MDAPIGFGKSIVVFALLCLASGLDACWAGDPATEGVITNELVALLRKAGDKDGTNYLVRAKDGQVTEMIIPGSVSAEADLTAIADCRALRKLIIRAPIDGRPLNAAEVRAVRQSDSLKELSLLCFVRPEPTLTRALGEMHGLEALRITYSPVSLADVDSIVKMERLRTLVIIHPYGFADEHVRRLAEAPALSSLVLISSDVTSNVMAVIPSFSTLTNAVVRGNSVTTNWSRPVNRH